MNGRVYDPYLGRFLSADSVIQNLAATQSINPYSYAWNDPLRYIDPSGHSLLGDILGAIVGAVLTYFTFGAALAFLASESVIGAAVWAGAIAGFVGGFVGALIATGSLSAALTAGLIGGVTGALFAGVGSYADDPARDWGIGEKVLAHAAVGCVSGELSSGNCGKGALSAAASEYLGQQVGHVADPNSLSNWGVAGQTAKFALIGGLASKVVGGNFVEGFSVGAAGYLLNDLSQRRLTHSEAVADAVESLTAQGKLVQGTEVYATNSLTGTTRFYDIVAVDQDGSELAFEVKTTSVGTLRLVSSQVAFDALTAEFPGSTTAYTGYGPVTIDRVGYLGYNVDGAAAAVWQAGVLQRTLVTLGVTFSVPKQLVKPIYPGVP